MNFLKSEKENMAFPKSVKELRHIEFYIRNLDKLRGRKVKYLFKLKPLIQREWEIEDDQGKEFKRVMDN